MHTCVFSVRCSEPIQMANTRLQANPQSDGTMEFVGGSVALYTCEDGFKFIGGGSTRSLVCQNDGSWHASSQPCTRE